MAPQEHLDNAILTPEFLKADRQFWSPAEWYCSEDLHVQNQFLKVLHKDPQLDVQWQGPADLLT